MYLCTACIVVTYTGVTDKLLWVLLTFLENELLKMTFVQESMHQLERQMKRICSLCEERQALAKKDTQLYNGEQTILFTAFLYF